jgi:hypothetical protein
MNTFRIAQLAHRDQLDARVDEWSAILCRAFPLMDIFDVVERLEVGRFEDFVPCGVRAGVRVAATATAATANMKRRANVNPFIMPGFYPETVSQVVWGRACFGRPPFCDGGFQNSIKSLFH